MFNFIRKTYTIKFKKKKQYDMSRTGILLGRCFTINTGEIISRVTLFCIENNIKLKKIYGPDTYGENMVIKIYGTQEDYNKLIALLTSGILMSYIEITNLKW